jgi:hypothetical protein
MQCLQSHVVVSIMRALVIRFGSLDSVAEAINVAVPGASCCKGTISLRLRGEREWPLTHVLALEDAFGDYPISRLIAGRLADRQRGEGMPLAQAAGVAARENGEAVAAILRADQSDRAGDLAEAIRETREAREALEDAEAALERRARSLSEGFNSPRKPKRDAR